MSTYTVRIDIEDATTGMKKTLCENITVELAPSGFYLASSASCSFVSSGEAPLLALFEHLQTLWWQKTRENERGQDRRAEGA